jgi:hypothetical protein
MSLNLALNYFPQQPSFIFIEQCLCVAFNIIWTTISQKIGPFITDSQWEYTHTFFFLFLINIFYKTFPALIYKQFLCYDVTITTGLLCRLHLQKQAVRLNITSDNIQLMTFHKVDTVIYQPRGSDVHKLWIVAVS